MYRAHSVTRSAWWFDNGPSGRFNLSGPRGTCYTATKVETAVREKVRDEISSSGVVSKAFAESFAVSVITAPVRYKCAAVSSARAVAFNVVRALVTMDDYSVPQAWAKSFETNQFEGVYYGSAYTTGAASALALFGDAGAAGAGFTAALHMEGPDACAAAGMVVAGPPSLTALTLI
ncbi:RES family NAD+ phosphorylase [Naasia sp. SYSU D00948]|uniref:RES family NAD+ phosphorylase n=1 Tax=Naasia sp. SYSU D00948 TaxID=2817379 RepID=UPI001B30B565|nr:RES family NAD+ phosphorylase [Naasia sp. SYSU D00948]